MENIIDTKKDKEVKPENLKQLQAFEYYYSLGSNRNIQAVSKQFKRTDRTIYGWSGCYNWKERVMQRDIVIGKELAHKNINAVIDEKANYRKIIKLGMMEFVKELKDGTIKLRTVADYERMVKLDLILMGEASEITQNTTEVGMTDADRQAMKEYADAMKESLKAHYKVAE